MPLSERSYKHVDTTTKSPSIATMEQFLGGGESARRMSPTYSPTSASSPSSPYFGVKPHDLEEDQGLYQRKSVLTKVKERARKLVLRNSLSRKRQDDENLTPSWGVSLEDEDEEEEDPEYLGAPIYESELAPEEYKENARQHPRANPVISEKRVLRTMKSGEQDQENALTPIKSTTTTNTPQLATTTATATPTNSQKQNTTMPQKLTPSHIEVSNSNTSSQTASPNKYYVGSITPVAPFTSLMMQNTSSSSSPLPTVKTHTTSPKSSNHSQVLMSPKRGSNGTGVIDRVRGAVSSLLRNDEQAHLKFSVKSPTARANSSQINNTAQEVGEGAENRGRILQTN